MRHSWTKYAFWDVNNAKWRKWCKFVSPFLFNNTYGPPVLTMGTKLSNQEFYDWLMLNRAWKRGSLQIMIFVYLLDRRLCWTKYTFWDVNDIIGVSLSHLSYLITHMAYPWPQRTPNVQIKYFMFDWLIYRLFELNTTFKNNSVQMMIFVNVCSKWSMVYIKDAF
jgi:hypothetical protein